LVTGIILQNGGRLLGWADDHTDISAKADRAIDRAIESSVYDMRVEGSDGREIEVPPQARRALGDAVGRLVKAEKDLAILRARDGSDEEIQAASVRRNQARAEVDRLKSVIEGLEQSTKMKQEAARDDVRRAVREDVRQAIRDVAGN